MSTDDRHVDARARRAARRSGASSFHPAWRGLAWFAGGLVATGAVALAMRPVRVLNLLSAVRSHRTGQDLRYGTLPRQRLDLYQPRPGRGSTAGPLVVFVYGGSWNRGERSDYRFVGEALAARGITTAIVDYRLYPEVGYPAFLQDVALAADFALAHAAEWGADRQRVVLMGHSAGAYNVAMLALDRRWLAAVGRRPDEFAGWIGLAGPYDFLPIHDPEVKPVFRAPDVAPDTQPIVHAREAVHPLPAFLAAPRADTLVDPERSTGQLARVLRERGGRVVEHRYDGVDHATLIGAFSWPLSDRAPVREDVVAYIDQLPPAMAATSSASGPVR